MDKLTYDVAALSNIDRRNSFYFPIAIWGLFSQEMARIIGSSGAFGDTKSLFSNASVEPSSKRVVYEGQILMILPYACESWCLTEKLSNQLRAFHARCAPAMCRVNHIYVRLHHITTKELLDRLGLKSLDAYSSVPNKRGDVYQFLDF